MDRLHLHEVELRFREPLATPDGVFDARRSVIVGAEADGIVGWGEAPAFPSGRWGTSDGAWEALTQAGGPSSETPLPPIASAALQAATADMEARSEGRALHHWLGGRAVPLPARHTFGLEDDPTELVEQVRRVGRDGVRAIKLKIRPGWDVAQVEAVRSAFPTHDISCDANGTYRDPDDPTFERLAAAKVGLIEQPLAPHDLEGHARLRSRGLVPVGIDEAIRSVADARRVLAAEAADVLCIKVNRLGLQASGEILRLARERGVGIKAGGTFDTAIGRRHVLAFAMLEGVVDAEIAPPDGYLQADLADYPPLFGGTVAPDSAPGIGTDPDPDRLAAVELRRAIVQW